MIEMSTELADKHISSDIPVAFVGGGGRGIGRCIAQTLAKSGFFVWVVSRTIEELLETKQLIKKTGGECEIVSADLSNREMVSDVMERCIKINRRLDVLVNCAGMHSHNYSVENYPVEYWKNIIEVNLNSAFYSIQAAVPTMKLQGYGRIINIGSVASVTGFAKSCGYVAAKHGLVGLTRALAIELGRDNITVNIVNPGFVETSMTEQKTDLKTAIEQRAALGRIVNDYEVAGLVDYLAGPRSGAITGQVINVCAGLII